MKAFEYEEILKNLISYPSINPPGGELEVAQYLEKLLTDMGFRTTLQMVSENRANVIAEYGPEDAEESFMLNGHIDVVGVDDGWDTDPFTLTKKDGAYYGRGTCDMKGQVAAMIVAAKRFMDSGDSAKRKLMLGFVADEEIGGTGARTMLNSGIVPTYAAIGEPTEMTIDIAHRGVNHYGVTIKGRAGHASAPQNSLNPNYPAAMFLLEIEKLQERLKEKKHFILPAPTVSADIVRGGVQWNAIPETCTIEIDRRTIPGETEEFVLEEYEEIIEKVRQKYPDYTYEHTYISGIPSTEPQEGFVLQDICKEVLEEMNLPAEIRDFPAGCDQYQFVSHGTDCLLIGPGSLKQAHTANEFLLVEEAEKGIEFYYNLIKKMM